MVFWMGCRWLGQDREYCFTPRGIGHGKGSCRWRQMQSGRTLLESRKMWGMGTFGGG